jgi:branched-chain amino acid transport system substrate-binding protein
MVASPRRRSGGAIAAALAVGLVSACQLIAGIDEKTPGESTPAPDGSAPDTAVAAPPPDAVAPETSPGAECAKHVDCVTTHGENWVCIKPEGVCRSLLDEDCEVVLAGGRGAPPAQKEEVLTDDNTIFFGFIADLRGSGKNIGIARRQAVELAVSDIHTVTKGIPGGPGGTRRPIAVVTCSETKDATSAADPKVPARHLVEDLHVPAILGASNSDTTIDLFNGYAFAKGTLVFSPNALSTELSSPSDDGLFWRTSATSVLQAHAIQEQINLVEQELRASRPPDAGDAPPLKLALVYIDDAFGTDIFPLIRTGLTFNGVPIDTGVNGETCTSVPCGSRILVEQYAPSAQLDVLQAVARDVVGFAPDIVVAIGRRDAVQVAESVEAQNPRPLPIYLFTQGAATMDLTSLLTPDPNSHSIRSRVRGMRPLESPLVATEFVPLYNTAFPAGPPSGTGVPGSFDITYLFAYAALAAPGDAASALTGARINDGLRRVLDPKGTPYHVGTGDLANALDTISLGHDVDMLGMSYIFDFDVDAGEAPGKVDVWCVTTPTNLIASSGEIFDPTIDGGATTNADGGVPPVFRCPDGI